MGRVVSLGELVPLRAEARLEGKTVVFTNGCFDILHRGHIDILARARELGDLLVVGLNSDDSVRGLKGPSRPLVPEEDRAAVVAALAAVDYVVLFEEATPLAVIRSLLPDVLVKGADYALSDVVGAEEVRAGGGRVELVPLTPGRSTSSLVQRLREPK